MNAEHLISLMSPTTLAGLVADIQNLNMGAESRDLEIERMANAALVAIVGEDEAERLVQQQIGVPA